MGFLFLALFAPKFLQLKVDVETLNRFKGTFHFFILLVVNMPRGVKVNDDVIEIPNNQMHSLSMEKRQLCISHNGRSEVAQRERGHVQRKEGSFFFSLSMQKRSRDW